MAILSGKMGRRVKLFSIVILTALLVNIWSSASTLNLQSTGGSDAKDRYAQEIEVPLYYKVQSVYKHGIVVIVVSSLAAVVLLRRRRRGWSLIISW